MNGHKQLSPIFFMGCLVFITLLLNLSCDSSKVTGTLENTPADSSPVNDSNAGNSTTDRQAVDNPNEENPEAVREVLEGIRTEANAAWWGFDENDATRELQSAINSGAEKLIVPNMGKDWIVRPINLVGEMELVFEEGVVVTAKKGEFKGTHDRLFTARNVNNLTIRGYGAIFKMQKSDYQNSSLYTKAEWRNTLILGGCTNITIMGLTFKDSGGDGITLDTGTYLRDNINIHIKDVVCDNNYRQGISIIGADNLLIEDSYFINTSGTGPSSNKLLIRIPSPVMLVTRQFSNLTEISSASGLFKLKAKRIPGPALS